MKQWNKIYHSSSYFYSYIRIFSGRPWLLYSEANFLTDAKELTSNSMASTLAEGISLTIASLTSLPAAIFLTAIITWTPRKARTRAVSVPIPLDAPMITMSKQQIKNEQQKLLIYKAHTYVNQLPLMFKTSTYFLQLCRPCPIQKQKSRKCPKHQYQRKIKNFHISEFSSSLKLKERGGGGVVGFGIQNSFLKIPQILMFFQDSTMFILSTTQK